MIQANVVLFERLRQYCAARSQPVTAAERYVQGDLVAMDRLQRSTIKRYHRFGRRRAAAFFDLPLGDNSNESGEAAHDGSINAFVFVGFESDLELERSIAMDIDPGTWVTSIVELGVVPNVSPREILDVVEAGSKSDSDYEGHDPSRMYALFPSFQVFALDAGISVEDFWPIVLLACLQDCELGLSWIDDALAGQLAAGESHSVVSIPVRPSTALLT